MKVKALRTILDSMAELHGRLGHGDLNQALASLSAALKSGDNSDVAKLVAAVKARRASRGQA